MADRNPTADAPQALIAKQRYSMLVKKIGETGQLSDLLALFAAELNNLGIDGHLINLLDEPREHLVCEHIVLPAELADIASTYHHFRFPLHIADINVDAWRSQEPVIVGAESLECCSEATRTRFERWRMSSLAALPIFRGPSSIGTVMLFRRSGTVDEKMLAQAREIAGLFAAPLRNALRYRNIEQKKHAAASGLTAQRELLQFIAHINSLTSSDTIYELISREFLARFPFDLAAVMIRQGDQLVVRKVTSRSEDNVPLQEALEDYFATRSFDLSAADGASSTVYLQNHHLFFPDGLNVMHLPMSPTDRGALEVIETPRGILIMPIRHHDKPVGVLWMVSVQAAMELSEQELDFIDLLCSFVGTAVSNADLYIQVGRQKREIELLNRSLEEKLEELRVLASRDRLTGLANFGAFEAELGRRLAEYERPRKRAEHLSLVLLDVDHFKRFNDSHGHPAGNAALQEIACRLQQAARSMDFTCRYGGEEFVIVLPKCDLEGARLFGERLRRVVEASPIQIGKLTVPVTISVGCACFRPGEAQSVFIERVDRALYRAKENGRNRTEMEEQ